MDEKMKAMTELPDGLSKTREEFIVRLQFEEQALNKPLTVDDLITILEPTIKHDNPNKVITLLTMLLTYTENDQINIGFLAESSTGKSYIPLELSGLFDPHDVIKLGYVSPSAFFHEWGIALPDPGDTRDVEEEKKRRIIHVDLHQKILLFLDQPHDQLLQRLRSMLSHDEKQITVKIADRSQKSGLRTKTVVIEGFATVIFCTAKFTMQDQEKTRLLMLSPEIDQDKLRETIALKIDKESDRDAFFKRVNDDPQRHMLAARIEAVKCARIREVKIPEELRNSIYTHFMETHRFLIPRHQRDITRLMAIIKGHALLNFKARERIEDNIYVKEEDVLAGFQLYLTVSEANEIGLSPELFTIHKKLEPHIRDTVAGVTRKEFQKLYFDEFHKVMGRESADNILKAWESAGLIVSQQDSIDKRLVRYVYPDMGYATPEKSTTSTLEDTFKDDIEEAKYATHHEAVASVTPGEDTHSLEGESSLSIREVLEKVGPQLTEVFPEEKLLSQVVGLGFSKEEAQKRIDHFKMKEIISKDDVGNWYFVR